MKPECTRAQSGAAARAGMPLLQQLLTGLPMLQLVATASSAVAPAALPRARVLPVLAPVAVTPAAGRWRQASFLISFWVNGGGYPVFNSSMPDASEQWARAASLNFTSTQQWFEPPATWGRQLELARGSGMQAMLRACDDDPGDGGSLFGTQCAGISAKPLPLDAAVLGYWLSDEPSAGDYSFLANLSAEVSRRAPGKLRFINLLPSYATKGGRKTQLGTKTYDEYVARFVQEVQPDLLCMDYCESRTFALPLCDVKECPRSRANTNVQ